MKFPHKLFALAAAAALPLAVIACDTTPEDEFPPADELATPDAPVPAPELTQPMEQTATFEPLNDSGISGQVIASAEGSQTRVQVLIAGAQPNATLQGHIHRGTCDAPGEVVAPLEAVETNDEGSGESTSTVSADPLAVFDGGHIVVYHEAGGEPGAPVTCAALPRTM